MRRSQEKEFIRNPNLHAVTSALLCAPPHPGYWTRTLTIGACRRNCCSKLFTMKTCAKKDYMPLAAQGCSEYWPEKWTVKDKRLSRSNDPLRLLVAANKNEDKENIKTKGERKKTVKRTNCLMQFNQLPVGWRMSWISENFRIQTTKSKKLLSAKTIKQRM